MTAWLLALALALPDDRRTVEVECPVDGTKFKAIEILTTNSWGGIDADFCPHAYKTTPLEHRVWICPSCRFAGTKRDFETPLPEEDRKALLEGLKEVPGNAKFDLLAHVARIRKAPAREVGRAFLHASWICRQQGAVPLDLFEEWTDLLGRYGLDKTPFDLGKEKNRTLYDLKAARRVEADLSKGRFKGADLLLARYLAAYLHRKHGENGDALKGLDDLKSRRGENSVVDDAAEAMRASIGEERRYQELATVEYEKAMEENASAEIAYLLGELHRRRDLPEAAAPWYARALESSPSEPLRHLIKQQQSLTTK